MQRIALIALAAVALVYGVGEGFVSHGTHGRMLALVGFFALVFLTQGGGAPPPPEL